MTLSMGLITVLSHLELAQIRISMLRLDSSNLGIMNYLYARYESQVNVLFNQTTIAVTPLDCTNKMLRTLFELFQSTCISMHWH